MKSVLTLVSGREDRVLRRIRISEIVRNPNQPRRYFDPEAIATLAESIRQYGVLNPLTVRRTGNGGYELVAGERRLRAAQSRKWRVTTSVGSVTAVRFITLFFSSSSAENFNKSSIIFSLTSGKNSFSPVYSSSRSVKPFPPFDVFRYRSSAQ